MIRICRERAKEKKFADFGVVYHHQQRSSVGCTVRLGKVLKTYPDGRMEIITLGQQRFEIQDISYDAEYEQANVTWMEDEFPDWDEHLANEAYGLHRMLIHSITGSFPPDDYYDGMSALSFPIAQSSGLTFDLKQKLLESRSENDRLHLLVEHLRDLLPMVETVDAARTSIHNNWSMQQALKSKQGLA